MNNLTATKVVVTILVVTFFLPIVGVLANVVALGLQIGILKLIG